MLRILDVREGNGFIWLRRGYTVGCYEHVTTHSGPTDEEKFIKCLGTCKLSKIPHEVNE
jgi:hypothetical protein